MACDDDPEVEKEKSRLQVTVNIFFSKIIIIMLIILFRKNYDLMQNADYLVQQNYNSNDDYLVQ